MTEPRDKTAKRKRTEEALRESEERYRDLLENANDLIQSVTPEGSFIYVNRAWRETLGYSEDEIPGLSLMDIIHPDSKAHCAETFQRVMAGEDIERVEAMFVAKDGRTITVEGNINCRFKDGKPVATRGIFRDITQRKQAEEALRIKDRAIASSTNAIAIADLEGNLTYVNASFLSLWGYVEQEVLGKPATGFWEMEERAAEVVQELRWEGSWIGELVARKKDGSLFYVQLSASMVTNEAGEPVCMMGSFVDITERRQALQALRKRTHDLGERVKELNCLYGISNLVHRPDISLEEMLQGTVDLIPPGWQYPEVTCARITLEGQEFRTENFRETVWRQTSDIIVNGERSGAVEVCYLEERRESDEGSFLPEKGDLINAIAQRLGRVIERRQAEEALRESEAKYRRIFESIQDVFYRTDAEGIITEISPSIEQFGFTREALIGTQVLEVYENPEQRSALLKAIMERGEVTDYEIRLKAGDGRLVDTSVSAHILRGPDGTPIGIEGTLRDISERRRAEEALRSHAAELEDLNRRLVQAHEELDGSRSQLVEKSALLQSVVEAQVVPLSEQLQGTASMVLSRLAGVVPADAFALAIVSEDQPLVLIFAPAGLSRRVTDEIRHRMSEAAEIVLGRKLSRTIPLGFEPITSGSTKVGSIRSHAILPLTSSDLETQVLGGMFSGKADAFEDDHVALFSAAGVSLASLYLARIVHAKEEELQRRQSEFVATVSHELRTPLHSIWGFVKLLLAGKVQDEKVRGEFLGIIDRECAHLAALVGDFLDVSKIEAGRMEMRKEPLSLDELATKTVAAFKTVADEKALTIDTDLPADLPPVEGDTERLGQVLANLVSNAIKFSEAGGRIMVRARVEGPELVVSVQDQGIGIATEALPHLFERFYQADDSGTRWRGGTGLGLYISRQIVEAHGGRIWVDSNVGEGSTFSFALPMHPSGTEDIRNDKAA